MPESRTDISPDQVEYLASIGCTVNEIADLYGCHRDTLHKHYQQNITKGRAHKKERLRKLQWDAAKKGNVTMLIWLGKQELGQSEFGLSDSDEEKRNYEQ